MTARLCLEQHQISLRIGHAVIPPEATGDPELADVLRAYNRAAAIEGLADELNPALLDPDKVAAFLEGLCRLPEEILDRLERSVIYLNAPGLPLSPADPVRAGALRAGWPVESFESEPGALVQLAIQAPPDLDLAGAHLQSARAATREFEEQVLALEAEVAGMKQRGRGYARALRRLSELKSKRFYAASVWRDSARILSEADPADVALAEEAGKAAAAALVYVAPPRSGMPGGGPPGGAPP
jgi:hypothetical protein